MKRTEERPSSWNPDTKISHNDFDEWFEAQNKKQKGTKPTAQDTESSKYTVSADLVTSIHTHIHLYVHVSISRSFIFTFFTLSYFHYPKSYLSLSFNFFSQSFIFIFFHPSIFSLNLI